MYANHMKRSGRPLKTALLTALASGLMALLGASPAGAVVLSFGDFPGDVFGGEQCADVQGGSLNNVLQSIPTTARRRPTSNSNSAARPFMRWAGKPASMSHSPATIRRLEPQ
jgi:hypothetical protein